MIFIRYKNKILKTGLTKVLHKNLTDKFKYQN